jgi:hypothetical protein
MGGNQSSLREEEIFNELVASHSKKTGLHPDQTEIKSFRKHAKAIHYQEYVEQMKRQKVDHIKSIVQIAIDYQAHFYSHRCKHVEHDHDYRPFIEQAVQELKEEGYLVNIKIERKMMTSETSKHYYLDILWRRADAS